VISPQIHKRFKSNWKMLLLLMEARIQTQSSNKMDKEQLKTELVVKLTQMKINTSWLQRVPK